MKKTREYWQENREKLGKSAGKRGRKAQNPRGTRPQIQGKGMNIPQALREFPNFGKNPEKSALGKRKKRRQSQP